MDLDGFGWILYEFGWILYGFGWISGEIVDRWIELNGFGWIRMDLD